MELVRPSYKKNEHWNVTYAAVHQIFINPAKESSVAE